MSRGKARNRNPKYSRLALRRAHNPLSNNLNLVEHALDFGGEGASAGRQFHSAVVSVEQFDAEFLFQGLNLAPKRGRGEVHGLCRAMVVQRLGEDEKVAELSEFQCSSEGDNVLEYASNSMVPHKLINGLETVETGFYVPPCH